MTVVAAVFESSVMHVMQCRAANARATAAAKVCYCETAAKAKEFVL